MAQGSPAEEEQQLKD
jgi:hypothetical protein